MRAHSFVRRALAPAIGLVALTIGAAAQETVVFRSGSVGGRPGAIPTVDDVGPVDDAVTCLVGTGCDRPVASTPFDSTHFDAAAAGSPAELVVPHDFWMPTLPSDPDARWIGWNHGAIGPATGPASGSARPAASVLYSMDFDVATPGTNPAMLELWFAVDDHLGDEVGPNPVGAYVNGQPLDEEFHGGHFTYETYAVGRTVVREGTNRLHLYQLDNGCAVSGILFSCRITVGSCDGGATPCAGTPNSTGATAALWATGERSVSANDLVLHAGGAPANTFGVALFGPRRGRIAFGNGVLCIDPFAPGSIHRLGPAARMDGSGAMSCAVDLDALPGGLVVQPGESWTFQVLFRDAAAGGAGFDLTDGLSLTFCP